MDASELALHLARVSIHAAALRYGVEWEAVRLVARTIIMAVADDHIYTVVERFEVACGVAHQMLLMERS